MPTVERNFNFAPRTPLPTRYSRVRSNGGGKGRLFATNVQNEAAESLSEEAKKTIADAMNGLPDDVMAYVMAYTPASFFVVVVLVFW